MNVWLGVAYSGSDLAWRLFGFENGVMFRMGGGNWPITFPHSDTWNFKYLFYGQ